MSDNGSDQGGVSGNDGHQGANSEVNGTDHKIVQENHWDQFRHGMIGDQFRLGSHQGLDNAPPHFTFDNETNDLDSDVTDEELIEDEDRDQTIEGMTHMFKKPAA